MHMNALVALTKFLVQNINALSKDVRRHSTSALSSDIVDFTLANFSAAKQKRI
jgi:hypothetical protein